MTSITEAIFKGRYRKGFPTPPEALRQTSYSLTPQYLTRKAIEAVLAGGYTTTSNRNESPALRAAMTPPPVSTRRIAPALVWVGMFALAGAIGIASSHLPGHAVYARQARPADPVEVTRTVALKSPPAIAPVAEKPSTVATAAAALTHEMAQVTAPAPVAAAPMVAASPVNLVRLNPLVKSTTAKTIGVAEPFNKVPHPSTVSAPGGVAAQVQLEEVLYEGEPDTSVANVQRTESSSRPATRKADAEDHEDPHTAGLPRVEGIFWDKQRPMALVGSDIVEVGSTVGAFKVQEIKPGLVVLSDGAARLELRP